MLGMMRMYGNSKVFHIRTHVKFSSRRNWDWGLGGFESLKWYEGLDVWAIVWRRDWV